MMKFLDNAGYLVECGRLEQPNVGFDPANRHGNCRSILPIFDAASPEIPSPMCHEALMILGFGLTGVMMRCRKSAAAVAA